jgi:hypothetical protein
MMATARLQVDRCYAPRPPQSRQHGGPTQGMGVLSICSHSHLYAARQGGGGAIGSFLAISPKTMQCCHFLCRTVRK